MKRISPLLFTLLTASCGWNYLPSQSTVTLYDQVLWNPYGAVPTLDGLYVSLPRTGQVALLSPGKTPDSRLVAVGEGRIVNLSAAPDQRTVLAFVERYRCEPDDPKDLRWIHEVQDCPDGDLRVETEVDLIVDAEVTTRVEIAGQFNAVTYAPDGRFAVAYLDLNDQSLTLEGVVDLTSVAIVDLQDAQTHMVPVGFAADQVVFTKGSSGFTERALVLSRSRAASVDLVTDPLPFVTVTFSLTLDPDSEVIPVGVQLTPGGQYALIPVQGSSDLYVLDLENNSVNIIELASNPTDIHVNRAADRTVLVYGDGARAEVLDHDFFDIVPYTLDEGVSELRSGLAFEMLFDPNGNKDVYHLDLRSGRLQEYRLENPPIDLHVAPTQDFAIARTRAESGFSGDLIDAHPGFEVIDLTDTRGGTRPFLLQGDAVGLAWSHDEFSLHALVLQAGVETLFALDMYTGTPEEIELGDAPTAIGTMPDGHFFITHDAALGLVSFFDPNATENAIVEVGGFAALGALDEIAILEETP